MNVPSCHLAFTNPFNYILCDAAEVRMRRSQAIATQERALNLPILWIDMCFTYIDELILAQIEDSCSWEH